MTLSGKTFDARRRRAETERLVDALSSQVAECVLVLESTHSQLANQARDAAVAAALSARQVRGMKEPAKRWQELSQDIWQFLDEGDPGDEADPADVGGLPSSFPNRAIVAVAAFVRSTANDLDDLAQTLAEGERGDFAWVDDSLARVYECSAVLMDVVERGSWRSFVDTHHLSATQLSTLGELHEISPQTAIEDEPARSKLLVSAISDDTEEAAAIQGEVAAFQTVSEAGGQSSEYLAESDGGRRLGKSLYRRWRDLVSSISPTPRLSFCVLQSIVEVAVPTFAEQVLAPGFLNPPLPPRRVGQGNHLLFSGQPPPSDAEGRNSRQRRAIYYVDNMVLPAFHAPSQLEMPGRSWLVDVAGLGEVLHSDIKGKLESGRSAWCDYHPDAASWMGCALEELDGHSLPGSSRGNGDINHIAKLKADLQRRTNYRWSQGAELLDIGVFVVFFSVKTAYSDGISSWDRAPRTHKVCSFPPDGKGEPIALGYVANGLDAHGPSDVERRGRCER